MNREFFRDKKILITGHTGFKGSWLTLMLSGFGARIMGIALEPKTSDDFFVVNNVDQLCDSHICNISDYKAIQKKVVAFQPDLIFHLAAQPLVRYSYSNPLETWQTNVMGTANILEAARHIVAKCAIVVVTTDKVYQNNEWYYPYRESDRLGGKDPYSASKSATEMVVASYCHSFFHPQNFGEHQKSVATARAGNVIGGGDWSEDRLVPDIIKAISNNSVVNIRNPNAVRPWQHVLEPLYGYLLLGFNLYNESDKFSGAWNFGPYPEEVLEVKEVVQKAIDILGEGTYKVEENINKLHEATLLKLDISKSLEILKWKPRLKTDEAITWTLQWYKELFDNRAGIFDYSRKSIQEYLNLCEV